MRDANIFQLGMTVYLLSVITCNLKVLMIHKNPSFVAILGVLFSILLYMLTLFLTGYLPNQDSFGFLVMMYSPTIYLGILLCSIIVTALNYFLETDFDTTPLLSQ